MIILHSFIYYRARTKRVQRVKSQRVSRGILLQTNGLYLTVWASTPGASTQRERESKDNQDNRKRTAGSVQKRSVSLHCLPPSPFTAEHQAHAPHIPLKCATVW